MTRKASALSRYPEYEATIGIEVHVQLKTESKIFCSCPNKFGEQPNTNICPVCTASPGVLPVLNKKAVEYAIKAGLATNCSIAKISEFSRKHYTYPDLPKNYQITQADKPICENGFIEINVGGVSKKIRIQRIHMEEDAGKNIHATDTESFVDLNRAGTPLVEIVTHPDISSADEARDYLMQLHAIVQYVGISDANMEEGSFRADVNISVKKRDSEKLGTRVEMKNINSFKFIGQAIEYEIERHIGILDDGGKITQETRLWNTKDQKTVFMRSKEDAVDYRYFTDPDLPLLIIDEDWVSRIAKTIPELPHQKIARFVKEYGILAYDAEILAETIELGNFFENAVKRCNEPKQVSNWMLRNLLGYLKEHKLSLSECKVKPDMLAELIEEIVKDVINSKTAQDVFNEMAETGKYPSIIIQEKDLRQVGASGPR